MILGEGWGNVLHIDSGLSGNHFQHDFIHLHKANLPRQHARQAAALLPAALACPSPAIRGGGQGACILSCASRTWSERNCQDGEGSGAQAKDALLTVLAMLDAGYFAVLASYRHASNLRRFLGLITCSNRVRISAPSVILTPSRVSSGTTRGRMSRPDTQRSSPAPGGLLSLGAASSLVNDSPVFVCPFLVTFLSALRGQNPAVSVAFF